MLRKLVAVVSAVVVAAGFAVASATASDEPSRISVAKRTKGSGPPPVGAPPDTPSSPPPDTPGLPPDDSPPPPLVAEPPSSAPPPEVPAPPPVSPGPTPPAPAEIVGPDETVRPSLGVPEDAPVRLPQTGAGARPLTATAGASLLVAGLAVIAGARQRARVRQPALARRR